MDDRVLTPVSRLSTEASKEFTDRIEDRLAVHDRQVKRTISPVYIDPLTSEPMATMAVPVINVLGDFKGKLIAEINLKSIIGLTPFRKH